MNCSYIPTKEEKHSEVEVFLMQPGPGAERSWVMEKCPYCGKEHRHKAGGPDEDPGSFLGLQPSLCRRKYPGDRGYMLIEKGR